MKHLITFVALMCLTGFLGKAQTASDILDNGIPLKSGEKIILQFDLSSNTLMYDVGSAGTGKPLDFIKYIDKSYFLPRRNSVNIYMRPLNPLNLSINSSVVYRVDAIDSAAMGALKKITNQIGQMSKLAEKGAPAFAFTHIENSAPIDCKAALSLFITGINNITEQLKDDQKKKITTDFSMLKKLTFEFEASTASSLTDIKGDVAKIKKHFDAVKASLDSITKSLDSFTCNDSFLYTQAATLAIKDATTEMDNQYKRFTALNQALDAVNNAYLAAATSPDNMQPWLVKIGSLTLSGKIGDFSLKINKSGFELSDAGEIQASKTESLASYTISARRYNLFVPEVAAGIVYSNISYPKYGTATDATGKMTVADAGSDKVSKFAVSTMVNFNMFIPNSYIRPFIQIGVGASTDYPALFLGGGIKISNSLSISVGAASPWVKQLGTLKVGDPVSGTADITKDLVSSFKIFEKVYGGIQIKL